MLSTNPSASLAQLRLLQLVSPALPIGAYSYSQGLDMIALCEAETGAYDSHAQTDKPTLA